MGGEMPLSNGLNHVALLTADLDRFLSFCCEVFDATVLLDVTEDGMRHAGVDLGGGSALHAFCIDGNALPKRSERNLASILSALGRGNRRRWTFGISDRGGGRSCQFASGGNQALTS